MPPALLTYIIARELTGRATTEEEFRNRLRRFSRNSVVRLSSVLNLFDLENLSPFLADTSLADILSARYKQDKKLMFSLWTVENAVLQRRGPRKSTPLNQETEMLGAMIETQLGLKQP